VQQGTADLAIRIGLNSGPTTGGVLRGAKARFQLFGDVRVKCALQTLRWKQIMKLTNSMCLDSFQTVNTAARMESNGERNMIQVSQKTADLIEAAGKG
jgi:class 3 adenylate cyclase